MGEQGGALGERGKRLHTIYHCFQPGRVSRSQSSFLNWAGQVPRSQSSFLLSAGRVPESQLSFLVYSAQFGAGWDHEHARFGLSNGDVPEHCCFELC